ncbi:MAG: hypothetical protein NT062_23865 [Proteobacteria bacterium]|nr:hypothetical protein [Pseudomonadota bacterium]
MQQTTQALIPRPRGDLCTMHTPSAGAIIGTFMLLVSSAIATFLSGMPLISLALIASGFVIVLAASPRELPRTHAIEAFGIRTTFESVRIARAEIQRLVDETPRLGALLADVLERCDAAVALCERLALLTNPLERYLFAHHPDQLRLEVARLRELTMTSDDEQTTLALGHAIDARQREIATHQEIGMIRDRIHARLELSHASLESIGAMIVTLRVTEDEQVVLAAGSVAEKLAGADDELVDLRAAFAHEFAA